MELRPYQAAARDAILSEWAQGRQRTLLVLPTGCGKTIVFSALIEECVRAGERVLVLAHRGELLSQAADKLKRTTGLTAATEKAGESSLGSWYRVVVGSVQSLMRPGRLSRFEADYFDTIVIDEAHHCLSESYQRVLEHFPGAKVLGVTATPERSDLRNLGQYFDSLAYEYTLPKAIREGYLSPIQAMTIPLRLDISQVGMSGGDYKAGDLGDALDPYLERIASEMAAHCRGRHTEYEVLCNSMLLTEGWDCPLVDCIVVLRPTKSRSLYCQMVGRGTRLSEGKDHLLLLDFLWHTERH